MHTGCMSEATVATPSLCYCFSLVISADERTADEESGVSSAQCQHEGFALRDRHNPGMCRQYSSQAFCCACYA
ncbi:hypothetical protein BaRGS_00015774, partial [Batillaria attramentaria]